MLKSTSTSPPQKNINSYPETKCWRKEQESAPSASEIWRIPEERRNNAIAQCKHVVVVVVVSYPSCSRPWSHLFLLLTFNRPLSICLLCYFCWRETSSINVKAGSSSSSTKAFSFYRNTTGLSISFTILPSSLHFHLLELLVLVWNIHKTQYSSSTKAIIYKNIIVSTVIHCLLILPLVFPGLFFLLLLRWNIIHKSRLFVFIHKTFTFLL